MAFPRSPDSYGAISVVPNLTLTVYAELSKLRRLIDSAIGSMGSPGRNRLVWMVKFPTVSETKALKTKGPGGEPTGSVEKGW
jgi:hypothetical protein